MHVECVLDTNVLVYAAAGHDTPGKRDRALELIDETDFGLSTQVLQEFYVTVTRKLERPMRAVDALAWIEALDAFPCLPIDRSLVKIAAEMSERHRLAYWDAAIVAAAAELGAARLYTEDLNDGQTIAGVAITNPFVDLG